MEAVLTNGVDYVTCASSRNPSIKIIEKIPALYM